MGQTDRSKGRARSDGGTLDVSILKENLDQIVKGAKTTEYREMTPYWMERLVDTSKYGARDEESLRNLIAGDPDAPYRNFGVIRFHCGERSVSCEVRNIRAFPCHSFFAIRLGKIIDEGATSASSQQSL